MLKMKKKHLHVLKHHIIDMGNIYCVKYQDLSPVEMRLI